MDGRKHSNVRLSSAEKREEENVFLLCLRLSERKKKKKEKNGMPFRKVLFFIFPGKKERNHCCCCLHITPRSFLPFLQKVVVLPELSLTQLNLFPCCCPKGVYGGKVFCVPCITALVGGSGLVSYLLVGLYIQFPTRTNVKPCSYLRFVRCCTNLTEYKVARAVKRWRNLIVLLL